VVDNEPPTPRDDVVSRKPASGGSAVLIEDTDTPFLLVDPERVTRNVDRLRDRMAALGTGLRPHLKTAKSLDVASILFDGGTGPITVSTLGEAEAFAEAGYTDIVYAVGIAPHKLARVVALRERGVDLVVLLDTVDQATAVAQTSRRSGTSIPALIEIDCDGGRGGLLPEDPLLLKIAATLADGAAQPRGVLAHAGESYYCRTEEELVAAAEGERAAVVLAAGNLRDAGFDCPVVSVGSTPTAHHARDLSGVTEVRAGTYMFFDLVMAGIGVCSVEDIALSVVITVIGHRPDRGWILTDGGWMAMSRDRGTAEQLVDQGYGVVADLRGRIYPDLLLVDANQEHGTLRLRGGSTAALPDLPVGTQLRVLPNHACATAAQYDRYHVLGSGGEIHAVWPRIRGW
jgi:D-serine deaminase-like pyridoxal phosphate-dependent protein